MIYVTVMQWMEYSYIFPEGTYRKSIIYAGTSLEMAYAAAEELRQQAETLVAAAAKLGKGV